MVALLPTDITKGSVVPGVLGNVADLMDRVVMQEHLHDRDVFVQMNPRGPVAIHVLFSPKDANKNHVLFHWRICLFL